MHLESSEAAIFDPAMNPPFTPHPIANSRRGSALRSWLDGQIEVADERVTLPECGRGFSVFRPTPQSRKQLFEQAQRSPDRQLPYWADIWPSGIALGDVVAARSGELAGKLVLEIGSGLGVTAAATLEAGARLIAVDYTPLALGLCRYNALANVGTAPRTLAVNWRALGRSALARLEAAGPFPIILAADVLYESRDIDPLIDLISRLLAPDGMLWLSEPGRKVASRFLDTLALRGWRFTSQTAHGPWYGGLTDPVHVHFIRRQAQTRLPYSSIGGWRV
jgi:predicted nicotinamide N-methyase